ncbi:MAG: hypothetical protein COT17_06660 [Elusimicrobia bacterium CG08_land_8_20_14_0_20_51_18]|nr:MAG: hypothetical protein COT17_06660 [Elusimicrobia bacterium CG08_land_8_20_14_0_20_51_18]
MENTRLKTLIIEDEEKTVELIRTVIADRFHRAKFISSSPGDNVLKLAEGKLFRSEARYKELVENMNDVVFVVNPGGIIEYMSPQVFLVSGYKPEEMTGRAFLDFICEEDKPALKKSFEETLEGKISPLEFRYFRKNGGILWARSSGRPLVKDGKTVGVNGIVSDITESRKNAEDIKRLTDLYLTLSQSNQAMVRVKNEEELFSRMVKVLADCGHFDLALVAAPEENGSVKPLAFSGPISEVPQGLTITPDGWKPYVNCPASEALRSGKEVLINEWTEGKEEPWYRKTAAMGIRSAASFPLKKRGKITATLSLYSRESDFFTGERLKLIREMQGEMEYALEKIESEREKKKASDLLLLNQSRLKSIVDILQNNPATIQELLDRALAEAIKLTDSRGGCIYFYDEDKKQVIPGVCSGDFMKEYPLRDSRNCCEPDKTGIWGESVRQRRPIVINNFGDRQSVKKKHSEGLAAIGRFMAVPVFKEGKIVGTACVANKPADYDESDVLQLSLLIGMVWKHVDVKKAEKEMRILLACIGQSAEAVVVTDTQGLIQYVNPAFEKITGYPKREVLNKNPRILKSGKQGEAFYRDMWQTLASGGIFKCRIVNRKKDGAFYTEEETISPVKNAKGVIRNYVAVKRDISENLNMERQFAQSQKMETIGLLAGGVAHDFNNILTAIMSYSELVSRRLEPGDERLADTREIMSAAERGMALTRQLLAFSRKQVISPRALDLNKAVENMENILCRLIGENIKLSISCSKSPCTLFADPGQLEQIILNLVVNARDSMSGGGGIFIGTEILLPPENFFRSRTNLPKGRIVSLKIEDTGSGMSEETKRHVFEPFYTTKEQGKGTGLGLSTVFGIVKQNMGEIDFESEEGKGTAFTIYFPFLDTVDQPPADVKISKTRSEASETLLFVEDEDSLRRLGERVLKAEGYRVFTARDGAEALETAEKSGLVFDLLVTDIIIPGISGKELSMELAKRKKIKKTLYMSGYTEDIVGKHGVLEPGFSFIYKPFKTSCLLDKIRETLES